MSKSKSATPLHTKPLKYEPVTLTPIPCTLEELENHLRGFIKGFVAEEAQGRWLEFVVEKRSVWFPLETRGRNIKLYQKVNSLLSGGPDITGEYVHLIKGADRFPLSLARVYGATLGIYFDPQTEPCKMTAAEATTKSTENYTEAILSFVSGHKALFFDHEGGSWCVSGRPTFRADFFTKSELAVNLISAQKFKIRDMNLYYPRGQKQ